MSDLLESKSLATLAHEESVRGLLVRKALDEARQADAAEKRVIEEALQLLLVRFGVDREDSL